MFDEYVYHVNTHALENTGFNSKGSASPKSRRRARSILQEVALDPRAHSNGSATDGSSATRPGPPQADVKTYAHEFSGFSRLLIPVEDVHSPAVLTPLSKSEEDAIVLRVSTIELSDGLLEASELLQQNLTFDSIETANTGLALDFQQMADAHRQYCGQLLVQSAQVTDRLDRLIDGFRVVQKQAAEFEAGCHSIMSEQRRLESLVKGMAENLDIFNRLESATRTLNAPGSQLVKRDRFRTLLESLDTGLAYVQEHPTFKDIDLYQMRYRQCMTRALTLVQQAFAAQIKDITNVAQQTISANALNETTHSAVLYARFSTEAPWLKTLTDDLAKRYPSHQEYYGMYAECLRAYFAVRHKLVWPLVSRFAETNSRDPRDVLQVARSNLDFYRRLYSDEHGLFVKIFSEGSAEFGDWFADLCEPLYDILRQRVLRETDISVLCELTTLILNYEEEDDQDQAQAESRTIDHTRTQYRSLFDSTLRDLQSRLVFRALAYLDSDIVRYQPVAEDFAAVSHRRNSAKGSELDSLFEGWYTPMRKAVVLLSQIYQLINSAVFDDLAHRIVHECILSLESARKLATTRLGALEAYLFLIKHLLILRGQIAEFDIEHVPAELQVDFSGLQEVLARVRTEGVDFTSAGLLRMAYSSVPKVISNMLDAKEELYATLKNAITGFTEHSVKSIVEPIHEPSPAPEQAADRTRELRERASSEFPRLRALIDDYIQDPRTTDILLDSIQDLVMQSYRNYLDKIRASASTEVMEVLMDEHGLMSWLGDLISRLHHASKN